MSNPIDVLLGKKSKSTKPGDKYLPKQPKEKEVITPREGMPYNKTEAIVTYILGYTEDNGVQERQLDMYSGLTGYHIRTVPGRRWKNPVLVGSGGGFLAIVDRFADYDLIRITDEYCGLSESDFEVDSGIVKDSVNLESIADLGKVTLPKGSFVQGLTILPRGMLIANITSAEGPTFIKFDAASLLDGVTQPGFNGTQTLQEPFTSGKLLGNPARYDMLVGKGMYYFLTIVEDSLGERGVAVVNFMDGKVDAFIGLSNIYTPISLCQGSSMIHVLVKDASSKDSFGTKILRLPMVNGNYLMTGGVENGRYIIEPQDTEVSYTYNSRDGVGNINGNPETLAQLLNMSKNVNNGGGIELAGESIKPNDLEVRPVATGYHISSKSVRGQSVETQELTGYLAKVSLPITTLTVPEGLKPYKLDCYANTLVESAYELDSDGNIDSTKSLFRVFHASHYDFLSDGGWTYGTPSKGGSDPQALITNSIIPIDSSIDNLVYKGSLKKLHDLRVILLDAWNGLPIYRNPKNSGITTYSGNFITVVTEEKNFGSDRDMIVEPLDGIYRRGNIRNAMRYENGDPYAAFMAQGNIDFDSPSELFKRLITPKKKHKVKITFKNWSKKDAYGATLPEWSLQSNPILAEGSYDTYWEFNGTRTENLTPVLQVSGYGGYFFLDTAKQKSTQAYEDQQDALDALLPEQKALKALENPTPEEQTRLTQVNADIATWNAVDTGVGDTIYTTPRNLLSRIFIVEECPAQIMTVAADGNSGTSNIISVVPVPITGTGFKAQETSSQVGEVSDVEFTYTDPDNEYDTITETKACAIAVDPAIRGWAAVTIKVMCDPGSNYSAIEGVSGYVNDDFIENGLGRNVGTNPNPHHAQPGNAFGKYAGYLYEAGYTASGGAVGVWEYKIDVIDVTGGVTSLRKGFDTDRVEQTAPDSIAASLAGYMTPDISFPGGWQKSFVGSTVLPLAAVRVTVNLYNIAANVFRFGYSTIQIADSSGGGESAPSSGNLWCPKADPGYYISNNCEGAACGNLECTSLLFGSHSKLLASDPTYPSTKQLIASATALYKFDADSYASFSVGKAIFCNLDFDFNSVIRNYRVDISKGTK